MTGNDPSVGHTDGRWCQECAADGRWRQLSRSVGRTAPGLRMRDDTGGAVPERAGVADFPHRAPRGSAARLDRGYPLASPFHDQCGIVSPSGTSSSDR
jgi:hypothetical protein